MNTPVLSGILCFLQLLFQILQVLGAEFSLFLNLDLVVLSSAPGLYEWGLLYFFPTKVINGIKKKYRFLYINFESRFAEFIDQLW